MPKNAKKKTSARQKTHTAGWNKKNFEETEINSLTERIKEEAPEKGSDPRRRDNDGNVLKVKFADLPLSEKTMTALRREKYVHLTDIQCASLPHALAGRDILGAAKTGSGKTLAFIIPTVENLYRIRWSRMDGLGSIIISPTRELALQIFDVLRKIGVSHQLSAGLAIGGKDFEEEKTRVTRMNLLVCTPGRLLQHMDETPEFDSSNVQILVLDEADRILDMGFEKTVNAIVENLPRERQTMLFSATQTKSVKDLARLSLKNPEYLAVHEHSKYVTPSKLTQSYMVCDLPKKLDTLYSFVRTHLKAKSLVFFSSCKQVRFIFEAFRKFRPGVPLMHLHGKQKQMKRLSIYYEFCKAKHAVMFCTDVAARGLDFPTVDWVVQMDCPEDVETYIHRVGRTARNQAAGKSLLVLVPSEKAFVDKIMERKMPVRELHVNPKQQFSVAQKLSAMLAENEELKFAAQKMFVAYMRSVYLQKDKKIFDVNALPAEEFAESLGLSVTPRIRFVENKKKDKNMPYKLREALEPQKSKKRKQESSDESGSNSDDGSEEDGEGDASEMDSSSSDESVSKKKIQNERRKTKVEKLMAKKNNTVYDSTRAQLRGDFSDDDSDDDDDVLVVKRKDHRLEEDDELEAGPEVTLKAKPVAKKKEQAKLMKKLGQTATKIKFDASGEAEESSDEDHAAQAKKRMSDLAQKLKVVDAEDKMALKQRLKEERLKQRAKARAREAERGSGGPVAVLGTGGSDDDGSGSEEYESNESMDESESGDSESEDQRGSGHRTRQSPGKKRSAGGSAMTEEEMARQILRRRLG